MSGDSRNLQGAFHRRADETRRAESIQGSTSTQRFGLQTYGPGRVRPLTCSFTCAYIREPSLTVGHSLIEGDSVIGHQPTAEATVIRWHRRGSLYIGADIVVRVTGHRRQRLHVRVTFTERALTYPIGPTIGAATLSDTL